MLKKSLLADLAAQNFSVDGVPPAFADEPMSDCATITKYGSDQKSSLLQLHITRVLKKSFLADLAAQDFSIDGVPPALLTSLKVRTSSSSVSSWNIHPLHGSSEKIALALTMINAFSVSRNCVLFGPSVPLLLCILVL